MGLVPRKTESFLWHFSIYNCSLLSCIMWLIDCCNAIVVTNKKDNEKYGKKKKTKTNIFDSVGRCNNWLFGVCLVSI